MLRRSTLSLAIPFLTKSLTCRNGTTVLRKTRMQIAGSDVLVNEPNKNAITTQKQCFSVDSSNIQGPLSQNLYETISNETLESLLECCESFEDLQNCPKEFDATYANGVLTLSFGDHGTYVINKQSPNRQIWLSSPFSGPKRYDFENGKWIYKHDGISLHLLLTKEFSKIFGEEISLQECAYC